MTAPVSKIMPGVYLPTTGLENLKRSESADLETEKQRLRKVTKEFESLFLYQLLKTMRKTIPKDTADEGALFSDNLGKDTFMQMFDMELARKMARGGQGSISEVLYQSLEKVLEVQYGQKAEEKPIQQLKDSRPDIHSIPLPRHKQELPLSSPKPIPLSPERTPFRKISSASSPASSRTTSPTDPILARFGDIIEEAARETKLDSSVIYAIIKAESNGDPYAVSRAGAKGLMQLTDSTMQDYRVKEAFDPRENILAGSKYFKDLLERFGDLRLALAAYNAGPRNVERHGGIPPFKETRTYVDKVTGILASHRRLHAAATAKARVENDR